MKNLLTCVFMSTSLLVSAQGPSEVIDNKVHKIVMQFSSGDSLEQKTIIIQVGNIRASWPKAQIEVVCHSGGLDLLMTSKSKDPKSVAEFTAQGVVFAACNNSMRRRKLKKEDMLPTAVIVPSAMLELVTKQEKGWAYVKGAY